MGLILILFVMVQIFEKKHMTLPMSRFATTYFIIKKCEA